MTYEELVDKVRTIYEYADARQIFEHIAVQIDVEGEGAGTMYIEVAERQICVEPYDYRDRDGLVTTTGAVICQIAAETLSLREAYETGQLRISGNLDKFRLLENLKVFDQQKRN